MHILLGFLGIIASVAIWWWRFRYFGEAASHAVDTVGRMRGNLRRRKLRKQAEMSPVTAIDDPVVAAATILVSIHSEDQPLLPDQEEAIRSELSGIAAGDAVEEAVIYAKWAASQVADVPLVVDRAGKFLATRLNNAEKDQLVRMTEQVAEEAGEAPKFHRLRVERLRQKLGLMVVQ